MPSGDWSIQEIARLTGTTSRTLRHYGAIGLLTASSVARNGYRRYDATALVRLQRILLLRDLGLSLAAIGEILALDDHVPGYPKGQMAESQAVALERHVALLRTERERLVRQIAAVEHTISALRRKGELMVTEMFDGFDHTTFDQEVSARWGADAAATSDAWWRAMSAPERVLWQEQTDGLARDWRRAWQSGVDPASSQAAALAQRHVQWLSKIPGTPGAGAAPQREYLLGLADMYVADQRFADNYGGQEGAQFVRDALFVYLTGSSE